MAQESQQENGGASKYNGICKWFDTSKGFGFITMSNEQDVFVHQSDIHAKGFRSLLPGECVEFNLIRQNDGRYKAVSVTGPNGTYVKGSPKPQNSMTNNNNNNSNNNNNKQNNKYKTTKTTTRSKYNNNNNNNNNNNDYGNDSDSEYEFGMRKSDVEELLCQGVKPWDDDAMDVLAVLHGDYDY